MSLHISKCHIVEAKITDQKYFVERECQIPYTMPLQVHLKISLLLPKWKKESVLHEA